MPSLFGKHAIGYRDPGGTVAKSPVAIPAAAFGFPQGLSYVCEERFGNLASGYLEGAAGWIENDERSRLFDGALVITYEQALRFLADHLAGDSYYPVDDPEHNLRRARSQLALLEKLLASEGDLRRRINSI